MSFIVRSTASVGYYLFERIECSPRYCFVADRKSATRFKTREEAEAALKDSSNPTCGKIVRLREKSRLKGETVLVLRTVNSARRAYDGFVWPEKGYVEAPDWNPTKECGQGLHGCLYGVGDSTLFNWNQDALWQVVEVEKDRIIDLNKGKVKFPRGVVLYTGDRETAANMIADRYPGKAVIGAARTAGDRGTATAGYYGKAIAGYQGTAVAGNCGTATAGYQGTATAGHQGTATAGYQGTATAGHQGTATVGDYGKATAGDYGTAAAGGDYGMAIAGYRGTATAGDYGTAIAGDYGTAIAGYQGTAVAGYHGKAIAGYQGMVTAGEKGIIQIGYYDYAKERYRIVTGYVGEDCIEARKKYSLTRDGKFVEAT